MSKLEPLLLPLLAASGNRIICTYDISTFIKVQVRCHLSSNRFLFSSGSNERLHMSFFIDREGRFRRVTTIGFRREWLRPLGWLVDFVLREVEIEPGRILTVGELLRIVSPSKSPPGFPTAGHLKGFLRKKPSDALFDAKMFREFWDLHCPKLSDKEWCEEYPLRISD